MFVRNPCDGFARKDRESGEYERHPPQWRATEPFTRISHHTESGCSLTPPSGRANREMSTSRESGDGKFVDRDLFKDVIGRFASGVTIITSRHDDTDFGIPRNRRKASLRRQRRSVDHRTRPGTAFAGRVRWLCLRRDSYRVGVKTSVMEPIVSETGSPTHALSASRGTSPRALAVGS